jgi:hypothetical protein
MLRPSGTDPTFEPYQGGQIVTIDLGDTIYGGALDVTTGVLTVTHTYVDENAFGSVSSGTNAGGLHWVDTTTAVFDADKSSYCSMLTRKDGDAGWLATSPCYAMEGSNKVRVYCGESTTALFKSAYADLQIVCGSINSTEIQLSANDVKTLLGQNNIWSDAGTVDVEYRVDTGLYIDKRAEEAASHGGLTEDIKAALLQIARKVAYVDAHGQTYYNTLYNAMYPPADLVSISAVYTQSGAVYDTDTLDSLKSNLVVTAHMSDQTTRTVTEYTLSGTLTEGTSTITAAYGGKTATFTVTVSHSSTDYAYEIVGTGMVNTSGGVGNNTSYNLTSFFNLDSDYSALTFTHDAIDATVYCYIQFFNGDTYVDRKAVSKTTNTTRQCNYSDLGTVTKARCSFNPTSLTNVKFMKGLV